MTKLEVEEFPICTEKAVLVVESLRETEGEPQILRRAKATAHFLDNRTIFIEDDELFNMIDKYWYYLYTDCLKHM